MIVEKALKRGSFKLASGAISPVYVDAREVTLDAEGMYLTAQIMRDVLEDEDFEAIGGPTLGADPIIAAFATLGAVSGRPVTAFLVRKQPKEHGRKRGIEGPLEPKSRVVLVEDVVTTGQSVLAAADQVEAYGAKVVKIVALIDRLEGAAELLKAKGYEFEAIFRIDELQD